MPIPIKPLPDLTAKDRLRFWSKIDKRGPGECWPWQASRFKNGYGRFNWRYRRILANRVAFFLSTGIDPNPLLVLHSCDHPACCNPAHLSLGTIQENIHQAWERNRANSNAGEKHPRARLSADDIARIRANYIHGQYPRKALAEKYGVTPAHIGNIVHQRAWKHT